MSYPCMRVHFVHVLSQSLLMAVLMPDLCICEMLAKMSMRGQEMHNICRPHPVSCRRDAPTRGWRQISVLLYLARVLPSLIVVKVLSSHTSCYFTPYRSLHIQFTRVLPSCLLHCDIVQWHRVSVFFRSRVSSEPAKSFPSERFACFCSVIKFRPDDLMAKVFYTGFFYSSLLLSQKGWSSKGLWLPAEDVVNQPSWPRHL